MTVLVVSAALTFAAIGLAWCLDVAAERKAEPTFWDEVDR